MFRVYNVKNIFDMTERHEHLLSAYFANQLTDAEKSEILSLLNSDSSFAARFREMEQAYITACIPIFEKTRNNDFVTVQNRIGSRRGTVSFWRTFAVAASVLAVVLLGATLYTGQKFHDVECFLCESDIMTVVAKNGTGTETVLPDGTLVCLNASSSLSFNRHFGRYTRDVILDGEGYFEVAPDSRKVFRVHAGNTCVTVKGTRFNVQSYADEPELVVSLIEGSVVLNTISEEATLRPGTCAVVSRNNDKIRIEKADPYASDWTKGKFVFTDKSIPEILHRIERNFAIHFLYDENLFRDERFTGNFSLNLSIDEILSYIDVDKKYKWRRNEDTIEIYKR